MRKSLWELPDRGSPAHPALEAATEADVVVVGAGITGLTTAAMLVNERRRVIVLEALAIGSGTTGRTTAKVTAFQGLRYQAIREHHGTDSARAYAQAQLAGLSWLAGQAHAGNDSESMWDWRPAVTYATTPDGMRALVEEYNAARASGLPVEWSGADELPFATTGALALDQQGQLDPVAHLQALAEQIDRSPQGTIHENSRVTAVHGRGPYEVHTDRGSVRAEHVVIATLLPIVDRGLFFARAKPLTSYLVAVETDGPKPQGMYISAEEPTRSLRSVRTDSNDEVLLVGGEGHPNGRRIETGRNSDALVAWAKEHFTVRDVVASWSAHDYVPVDHLPWVGSSSPLTPNVLVAAGFEKWGMTMGTAAALILREQILGTSDGRTERFAGIFSPARTTPRGIFETAKLNGGVATEMISSWAQPSGNIAAGSAVTIRRRGLLPVAHRADPDEVGHEAGDLSIVCTHLGGVCRWNTAEETWDCPLHGSRFSADGEVLTGPATRRLSRSEGDDSAAAS